MKEEENRWKSLVLNLTNTGMEKLSNLWIELQKHNKLPGGGLTSSCQEELLELMRQLDIMLSTKKREWEHESQAIRSQLDMKDKELKIQTTTLEHKNRQVEELTSHLSEANQTRDDIVQQYETQLLQLNNEVQRMKREYEKLHKKHSRHTKEAQRAKAETTTEIEEGKSEIKQLKEKLEDCQHRLRDGEQQRKALKRHVETLESQKRALAEKCDFVQQQSQTYQSQIDRRRQLQDNTELSLKTTITQLEGQLERNSDTLNSKEEKIRKLKTSLGEAMNAHKRAMNDNERLLDDLKKANNAIRRLENDKQQLEIEMQSREDLLRAANEDAHQYSHDISLLEQSLSAKDDVIKNLGDSVRQEESDQVKLLRQSLHEVKDECRLHKKNQKKLRDEMSILETKLENAVKLRDSVADKLEEKESELHHLKGTEVRSLQNHVQELQDKLSIVENSHSAELAGMRDKLTHLTTDLHQRNASIASLNEKTTRLETRIITDRDSMEGKDAELKVAVAQIESLRAENRHLRQDFMEKLGTVCGRLETEHQLQIVSSEYTAVVARLERENENLREDLSRLKQELSSRETSFQEQQSNTVTSSLPPDQGHARSHHRGSMQGYMDSTARRYDSQIQLLQTQKHRLEEELEMERRNNRRITLNHGHQSDLDRSAGTILDSEPMSIIHTFHDLDSPTTSLDYDLESSADAAAELFLSQEQERAKELERIIDAHIEDLRVGTEHTLKKYAQK